MTLNEEQEKKQLLAFLELKRREEEEPSQFFVPNIGQERALSFFRGEGRELASCHPTIFVATAGNGGGKTSAMVNFMIGLSFEDGMVNPEFFSGFKTFEKMHAIRKGEHRPIRGRLICKADAMRKGGAVLNEIEKWFPKGRYGFKANGKQYTSLIECYERATGKIITTIEIKTHDQEKESHAGNTLDWILFDEPPPEDIYEESVGRIRTKWGGFLAFFLTPLEVAGWMIDQIIKDCDGVEKVHCNWSLWDNCSDKPGTRGHISEKVIQAQIREWSKSSPETLEARVEGKFTHLSGAVWKNWDRNIHMVDPFEIPREWPIYCIMDPHDAKPAALAWFAQGPRECYCIAEWPTQEYTKMETGQYSFDDVCSEMRRIEKEWREQVVYRYADPNKLNYTYPNQKKHTTLKQEFAKRGFVFQPADDHVEVGINKVSELLYFNKEKGFGFGNKPILYVFRHNPYIYGKEELRNVPNALERFGFKKKSINENSSGSITSKLDQTYKDFADLCRYFAMVKKQYSPIGLMQTMFTRMKNARINKYKNNLDIHRDY